MTIELAGLGTIVVDHQVMLDGYPQADTKVTAVGDRFQVGGPVPTALAVCRRFGHRCRFFGSWGDDTYGAMIEDDLAKEGISFSRARCRSSSRSGFAHVWVDRHDGSRTIACLRPGEPPTADSLDERVLRRVAALHLDGWPAEASLHAARIVHRQGGRVFLDTGSPKPGMDELIRTAHVVNCPRRFLTAFFGEDDVVRGGRRLLAMGPGLVTVTDGARGATLLSEREVIEQPGYEIDAADTTGAGDVFCGALICGVLAGWPAERILRWASATAALKCSRVGNRDALPATGEIQSFLAARSGSQFHEKSSTPPSGEVEP